MRRAQLMLSMTIGLLAGCSSASGPAAPVPGSDAATTSATPGREPTTEMEPEADSSVELHLDATRSINDVAITWVELNDSRCPTGVQCIWAGEARVTLDIAGERVELVVPAGRAADSATVGGRAYQLVAVEPHPRSGVETRRDEHVARLVIR